MQQQKRQIHLITFLVAIVGFGVWWYTRNYYLNVDLAGIILFSILHILSEVFSVQLPKDGVVSIGFALDIAAIIIFGPFLAALLSLGGIIGKLLTTSFQTIKFVFNVSLFLLTTSLAGLVYYWFGGSNVNLLLTHDLVPLVVTALVYLLINASLLTAIVAVANGVDFATTWRANVRWALPSFLALAPLGYLLATVYIIMGIPGAILLIIPLLLARFSFNQYIETKSAHLSVVQALATALEAKDSYTKGHSDRVAEYSALICRQLELPEDFTEDLIQAARMHDIGKIGVPEEILNKPGQLTGNEYELIKGHPRIGSNILEQVQFLNTVSTIIRYHHEWYNGGKGYPQELQGEAIPLGARILMVADSFDAMTTDRPYRSALSEVEALAQLVQGSGSQFDPTIVKAFITALKEANLSSVAGSARNWVNHRVAAAGEPQEPVAN